MLVFLLWHERDVPTQRADSERVARRLQEVFAPLFEVPPPAHTRTLPQAALVWLELPVKGWKPAYIQEDGRTWVLAAEHPIDAGNALAVRGVAVKETELLPELCRELERDPRGLLRDLAPPFSLIWGTKGTDVVVVQNDGLGQAQLFEFEDGRLWALTNKVLALAALDVRLEMEPKDWAVRTTVGSFLSDRTGYKGVRYPRAGTRLELGASGVTRTIHDVLSDWVHPDPLGRREALELARVSVWDHLRAALAQSDRPFVGLSGGYDTRAIVAILRALGADFSPRVKGLPGHIDVLIASRLAKIARLELTRRPEVGLPPEDPGGCRRCLGLALLWQAGYMESGQHKEFFALTDGMDGGFVNIMGQFGEIGRSLLAQRIAGTERDPGRYEERLLAFYLEKAPAFLRPELRDGVREALVEVYREVEGFGLEGIERLNFFSLLTRERRWGAGSINSQQGVVVTPFLSPGFVRAAYAYGPGKETHPFHRHIVEVHAPEWVTVPYSRDVGWLESEWQRATLAARERRRETGSGEEHPAGSAEGPSWKLPRPGMNYDSGLYWKMVGGPVLEAAFARDGAWTDVFDPDALRAGWDTAPDVAAIVLLMPDTLREVERRLRGTS